MEREIVSESEIGIGYEVAIGGEVEIRNDFETEHGSEHQDREFSFRVDSLDGIEDREYQNRKPGHGNSDYDFESECEFESKDEIEVGYEFEHRNLGYSLDTTESEYEFQANTEVNSGGIKIGEEEGSGTGRVLETHETRMRMMPDRRLPAIWG